MFEFVTENANNVNYIDTKLAINMENRAVPEASGAPYCNSKLYI